MVLGGRLRGCQETSVKLRLDRFVHWHTVLVNHRSWILLNLFLQVFTLFNHVYNVGHSLVHSLLRVNNLCLVLLNTIQRLLHLFVLRFNAVEGLQNFKGARADNFTIPRELVRDRLKTQFNGLGLICE